MEIILYLLRTTDVHFDKKTVSFGFKGKIQNPEEDKLTYYRNVLKYRYDSNIKKFQGEFDLEDEVYKKIKNNNNKIIF